MKYAVNEEGIEAMNAMANAITEALEEVRRLTDEIQSAADDYSDTLGPHKTSLDSALEDINASIKQASEPVNDVAEKLAEVAEAYQEIIGNDQIKRESGADMGAGAAASPGAKGAGSFFSRLFGREERAAAQKFGSFETGRYKNGSIVVKGEHFEQYMSDYYDSENSTYEALEGDPVYETISPGLIEGITLGASEAENSGRFWSQHDSEGTAETFREIASHIPQVRSELSAGRSLSDIKKDPVLGKCAAIYFDPANIPQVVKNDGYYEFSTNGRHRILAARELGYDIPVRIIGIRRRR